MQWVEIITLRSIDNIDRPLVDKLLKELDMVESFNQRPKGLVGIRIYQNYVVETDLSIHFHWKSEGDCQDKSSLGIRISSALKPLGLLNHSIWVEAGCS